MHFSHTTQSWRKGLTYPSPEMFETAILPTLTSHNSVFNAPLFPFKKTFCYVLCTLNAALQVLLFLFVNLLPLLVLRFSPSWAQHSWSDLLPVSSKWKAHMLPLSHHHACHLPLPCLFCQHGHSHYSFSKHTSWLCVSAFCFWGPYTLNIMTGIIV